MRRCVAVRCAKCGQWYRHYFNTPYICPNCGYDAVDDMRFPKRMLGKFGNAGGGA